MFGFLSASLHFSYSSVTSAMAGMLTATFEVGCHEIHDTQSVNREQNIIEKHTTA